MAENEFHKESVCLKCKKCYVLYPAEPQTRDYPGSPADLDCEIGNYENFGTRYGCWEWVEKNLREIDDG